MSFFLAGHVVNFLSVNMSGDIKGAPTRPFDINISPADGMKGKMNPRKLGNGNSSPTSPLKLFGQAKKRINDIFSELAGYVRESAAFLESKEMFQFNVICYNFIILSSLYIMSLYESTFSN